MEYAKVKQQIKEKLTVPQEFNDNDNLLELGLNSLIIMRLVNQWRKQGVKVPFGELMEHPTFAEWWAKILNGEKRKVKKKKRELLPEQDMCKPFPLTDVQYAYWIGRNNEQTLGGIGCHAYLEFDGEAVEYEKLESAWNKLQYHHPMLRARFLEDGTQVVMEKPYSEKIKVNDLTGLRTAEINDALQGVRERLSHRRLHVEKGEVAGIELSLLPDGKTRVHLDMDLLIADVQSLQVLLRDLETAYAGKPLPGVSKDWNFAAYLKKQALEDEDEKAQAKAYWDGRLEQLPLGPELPLAKRPDEICSTTFTRRIIKLDKGEWDALQAKAAEHKTTPALLLLTAYAAVLERWSKNKRFLINIPFFNRKTELLGLEEVIADFTTLLLLEVDCQGMPTFMELLDRIQKRLHQDMKHTAYSGVQVQRDLAKIYGGQLAAAPIVFACNLGTPLVDNVFRDSLGQFSYMISQTPQVWNDFQTYEDETGLQLTWDSVDGLFPEHMVEDMLESLETLLHELGKGTWDQRFDVLPRDQRKAICDSCVTAEPASPQCIHNAFLQHAKLYPDHMAVVDAGAGISLSYQELKAQAGAIAAGLLAQGLIEKTVAISLPRGYKQIAAVYGVLMSGNIYVPVSCEQPKERRQLIHEKTGVGIAITDAQMRDQIQWPEDTLVLTFEELLLNQPLAESPEVSPDDSAYIIMTSGTTGVPKGVEILHKSAWNTIRDINEKYQITGEDTALAVSALDFDLSVYDVFGILGAGGRLILLPETEKRNAEYWLEQVKKYHVSVWNSVPVLLDMLLVTAESMREQLPLRVVMLSGDWISMDLPERVNALTENCRFVAMGGATEASIWSNHQELTLPLPGCWKSIPYGRPLAHQAYRVVDADGRDCPFWVSGELWIGGYGVAKGYRGDPSLTNDKFVSDMYGRWYRTGDTGRIWKDGTIEFFGREDNQVKIRGHRIELGEIEHAVKGFPSVNNAVVDAFSDHGNKLLAACIEAELSPNNGLTKKVTGKNLFMNNWDKLTSSVEGWEEDEIQTAAFEEFLRYANTKSLQIMYKVLQTIGAFHSDEDTYTLKEILDKFKITDSQKNTVARWLDILCGEGLLKQEQGRFVRSGKEVNLLQKGVDEIDEYMRELEPHLVKMILGEETALTVFYQEHPNLGPNQLLNKIPGHKAHIGHILRSLKILSGNKTKIPFYVLEIGTREPEVTREILNTLEDINVAYTYADSSKYFLDNVKSELGQFEGIEFELLRPDESIEKQHFPLHSYDLIITWNSLHRNDAGQAITQISDLLAPSGGLLMSELVVKTYLQDITAALLENGFANISDERQESQSAVLNMGQWEHHLQKYGLDEGLIKKEQFGRTLMAARQKPEVLVYDESELQDYLKQKLPEYMLPKVYHFMKKLPVSTNGKIDRKQLREAYAEENQFLGFTGSTTDTEIKMSEVWSKLFGFEVLDVEENYFAVGGDSLMATRLITEIQKVFQCKVSISTIFENPTIKSLSKVIDEAGKDTDAGTGETLQIQPDPDKENDPFPLTDVQYAYWMGRSGLYDLGNVATHCYFELDAKGLDLERAEQAWNLLVRRHGMMRIIIQPDGKQRILKSVPKYTMNVLDIRKLNEEDRANALENKRREMSHQIIRTEEWPLFDVQITKMTENTQRIHISFDNIIFDGWSMFHILNEWSNVYRTGVAGDPIALSFRDYVIGLEQIKITPVYEKDKKYWKGRIENFAAAPDLPTAKGEKQIREQQFNRRSARLSQREWTSVKTVARRMGVTPSVLLMGAYAETLRLWSSNKDFTINLTQFDRKPLHPDVGELVGDFTTLTLLEILEKKGTSFSGRVKAIQKQLTEDLEHTSYSAIEVERDLKKKAGNIQGAIMPVVFTSGLGVEQWNEGKWLGKLTYNISQTPQVWLDHQVVEMDGCLCLFWDSVDELFYPGMLDEMFRTYVCLLQRIAECPAITEELKESLVYAEISENRRTANETHVKFDEKTLDEIFLKAAAKFPDKEAVVSVQRRMTYQELKDEALYISDQLQKYGVNRGETVAILMEKGWEQVVAVYGILFSGAAYLPVDIHNPQERIEKILCDSNTRVILTQKNTVSIGARLDEWKTFPVCGQKPDHFVLPRKNTEENLAYVIYTSGTTGMPKGVMISHHNAVNTIMDINSRYQITDKDTAFGISNLHFDLSVYDIFGLLGVGGTLVVPNPKRIKDPAHWVEMLNEEEITVWNSVPAFVEMLAEFEEHQNQLRSQTLRLILMSGDWIPPSLPARMRKIFYNISLIALGGATEGSIWSNSFGIPEIVPENWKSIPYGKPLANQRYYILNQDLENCPDWVPGILHIAGDGVAQGYLNDKEKADEKFIVWEETGERLYCTGDMGRYWNDGNIEFLGRVDNQVKINGYRVELGEIETSLLKIEGITDAFVLLKKSNLKETIWAILVEDERYYERKQELYRKELKEYIPTYMIPDKYIKVKRIPLTPNGKRDINSIKTLVEQHNQIPHQVTIAETKLSPLQNQLLQIWKEILKIEIGINDNFFEMGGNSLQAIQVVNQIVEKTGHFIDVGGLFEHPSIFELEKYMLEGTK